MADADRLPPRLWWVLVGLTFAWGFNWSAMKIALHEITPWVFRSLCLGLGSTVLFLVLRASGQKVTVPAGQWPRLALLAFFNITCWNLMVAYGLTMIASGRAAILAYTMPVLAVPLSVWLLGERLTSRKIAGLVLGLGGLALLLGEAVAGLGASPLGSLLALGAAFTWALGVVLQKRYPVSMPTLPYTAWIMLLGGVPVIIGSFVFEDWRVLGGAGRWAWLGVA
ncbi:MAG TPA: DMT family transporter, partial [Burkholderiales bacterium]|nr:DMT family transporter [Burkholderiales bacterium]